MVLAAALYLNTKCLREFEETAQLPRRQKSQWSIAQGAVDGFSNPD
jgi:hypothetical protein